MATDVEWRELIDRSFGDGPAPPPVVDRLVAGRRAVRRRRITGGITTAAAVMVIGGGVWTATPSEAPANGPVAGQTDTARQPGASIDFHGRLVTMTDAGWRLAPGWDSVARYTNPMHYRSPKRSVAMEIVSGSKRRVLLAVYDGQCCTSVHSEPATPGMIHEWLDRAVAAQEVRDRTANDPADSSGDEPVRLGSGETLIAADGVTILEQLPHPELPANFATDDERSAAALIDDHGARTFVLVREFNGEEQVIPYTGEFDSLDEFLAFAERQYQRGVGLL
jgi:hypothetical protein